MINSSLSIKGRIREISIEKECGKHAIMHINIIPNDLKNNSELFSFTKIGTDVEADIDGTLIMCGKIRNIEGRNTYSGATVAVLIVSDSLDSDTIEISRVYQSPEKTYKEICKKISEKATFEMKKSDISSKKIEDVIIQQNETDFQFANRIALENNTRLFVCSNERGNNQIIIDDSLSKSFSLKENDIISAKITITDNNESVEFEYKEYIELGTKVNYNNQEYILVRLRAIYKDDNTRFYYRIERIIKTKEKAKYPINLLSLGRAKVTDNKDKDNLGRIQVEFTELEDSINDKKIWIQYINAFTATDGGIFFVPDKDEIVEVIMQNNKCFAYGCIREKAVADKINNTDNKSLKIYDKTYVIEKDKIIFNAWDYVGEINENEIYIKNKEYNITLKKDSIVMGNDKNIFTISKNQIDLNYNSKSEIQITDKNIMSKAGSSSLEIKASSDVDVITKKFNVK